MPPGYRSFIKIDPWPNVFHNHNSHTRKRVCCFIFLRHNEKVNTRAKSSPVSVHGPGNSANIGLASRPGTTCPAGDTLSWKTSPRPQHSGVFRWTGSGAWSRRGEIIVSSASEGWFAVFTGCSGALVITDKLGETQLLGVAHYWR